MSRAEEVWREALDAMYMQQQERRTDGYAEGQAIIEAALQCSYREGVEAMDKAITQELGWPEWHDLAMNLLEGAPK